MADKIGGKIVETKDIDALIQQGEESRKAREAAMERRRQEEAAKQKEEEMKKLTEDAGTVSQEVRGKGGV